MSSIKNSFGLWDEIVGQPVAISALQRAIETNKVSHCMLFSGPRGSGRRAAAQALAAALNCPNGGCGECRTCKTISRDLDPDFIMCEPEGRFISIEQVRDLQREMSLKPFGSKNRFFLINESERLNNEASNALLKSLEEPHPNHYIVLVTESPEELKTTITSRAQLIRFSKVPKDRIKEMLEARFEMNAHLATVYANMAGGSVDKAVGFCETDWFKELREKVLSIPRSISESTPISVYATVEELLSAVKERMKEQKTRMDEHKKEMKELLQDEKRYKRFEKASDSRLKRLEAGLQREGTVLMIALLASYYRDLLILGKGLTGGDRKDLMINVDRIEEIERASRSIGSRTCEDILRILAVNQSQMDYNINISLFLETLFLSIQSRLNAS